MTSSFPVQPRETLIKSVRGECFSFVPSIRRAERGTQDERKMYRTIILDLISVSLEAIFANISPVAYLAELIGSSSTWVNIQNTRVM